MDRDCRIRRNASSYRTLKALRIWFSLILLAAPGSWVVPLRAAEPVVISTPHLQVAIDKQSGALLQLRDRTTGFEMLEDVPQTTPLWQLELAGGTTIFTGTNARSFRCERLEGKPAGLRMVWRDFGAAHPGLQVEARVRLDKALPLSHWQFRVAGIRHGELRKARFPQVPGLRAQANEYLAVPMWMGQVMSEPRKTLPGKAGKGQRHEWAYPGLLSMQCLAYYGEGGTGLYVACDDTSAFRKTFAVSSDAAGHVTCDLSHLPETGPASDTSWQMPYQVVLGTFQGDWITAAERYRAWATNQVWAKESRLAQAQVPEWILNTGLWVWNRGRSDQVLTPALELQQRLNMPVSVFWHWWHGCSYDAGFPEYLPPREGKEPFIKAMSNAHAHQVRALVYMNQRLWGTTTRSWTNEGAEPWAVKGPDGKIHPEVYNTFTKEPCVSMCMGTPFWRNKYAGLAEQAVRGLGVDGIYMDQACTSLACYDPAHHHPPGGGAYWIQGFRTMSQDIRRRVQPADGARGAIGLAGEGCGEPWLPYLDLMLSLQVSKERYAAPDGWETIPFFHAVYHAYAVLYGNYSSLTMPPYDELWPAAFAPQEPLKLLDRKFSRQFLMEQARAFVWGQQPTIANFQPSHLQDRRAEMDYVLNLAVIRRLAGEYLLRGSYLRPPQADAPEAILDMSRLSIYAGQQGGLTSFQQRFPLVISGAWRSPGGSVAVALASIADEPLALNFKVDTDYYRISRKAEVYRLDAQGRTDLGVLPRDRRVSITLPARGACLIEFTSARKGQ